MSFCSASGRNNSYKKSKKFYKILKIGEIDS